MNLQLTDASVIPRLAVALRCLPSEIENEEVEYVHAIIDVLNCEQKKKEKNLNKKNGRRQ